MLKKLCFSLVAVLTYSLALAQLPTNFSSIITLGDSLSDVGNVGTQNASPPCAAEYAPETDICTSPGADPTYCGKLWIQYLAQNLNLPLVPSRNGGTDFAALGAQMVGVNSFFPTSKPLFFNYNQPTQLSELFNFLGPITNPINSDALVTIWAGANDMNSFFLANIANAAELAPQFIFGEVNLISSGIKQLIDRGARHFVVVSVPDLSLTPEAQSFSAQIQEALKAISFNYDEQLKATLIKIARIYHVDIYYENTFQFLNFAVQGANLFANNAPTYWCLNSTGNPSTYLYFNLIHPSSRAHYFIAQDIENCDGFNSATNHASFCQKLS